MVCLSIGNIYILRVFFDVNFVKEVVKWINWGIDLEDFFV